jgi:integrase/recombinase XerC
MVLHHLTGDKNQIRGLSGLHHLTGRNSLVRHLQGFLLSCRVDGLSPRTLDDYEYKIGAFVVFCSGLGVDDPRRVTASEVRQFLLKLQDKGAPASVAGYYKSVKRFFNWLVEENILDRSPTARIRPPRVPQKVVVPFRPEHIKLLLLLCDDRTFVGARNKALVLAFLDTGLRLSEMAGIQLADIDFDRETVKVMGKGAKERVVRIGKTAQKALLRYLLMRRDDHPCLWVSEERRPLTHWGIAQVIDVLGKRAGIGDVRCSAHTFRHTFATRALLNGAGEFEVQSLLGHAKLDMTRRYAASLRSEEAVVGHRRFSPVDNMRLRL